MKRQWLAVASLVAALGAVPVPAGAVTISTITATCADGNFFDGVDTRYAASYCQTALQHAGYGATALSNTDATDALPGLPRDAVFFHHGHALVVESGSTGTAIASVFAGTSASSPTFTGLLGDPSAADFQGPSTICTDSSHCRDVTLVQYPYNSEMTKFNLAVFQSCNSAHDGVAGFISLARSAFDLGNVGTSIGFDTEVSVIANRPGVNIAGDAFSRRFWADLDNGSTYLSATVDAVNAAGGGTYGYSSYRYLHKAGAPTRLRPAQYWVVAQPVEGVTP